MRIGELTAELDARRHAVDRKTSPKDLVKAGDLVDVELVKIDGRHRDRARSSSRRCSRARSSPSTTAPAQMLAMVGGYSFARSKFNRATQAYRQMGSTVKPFLYTAAIDRGLTPTTLLVDEPTTFDAGAGQPPYTPGNYDRKYMGTMTLRRALEQSRNIPAVKVIEMLGPRRWPPMPSSSASRRTSARSCRWRSARRKRR